MKKRAALLLLTCLSGCGSSRVDDTVLIEFAAKLEAEYYRLKAADANPDATKKSATPEIHKESK